MANMTLEEALAAADVSTTPLNDILMIDAEARTIIVPASEMLFGVRQDMDAERKHFKCPKIVGDNVDLSNCHIYISYVPSKQDGTYDINEDVGAYLCEDLDVDGDYVTFSWKLSGNVFVKAGYIAFAVYAKQADADGNLQTKWHTTFAIGKVLDTLPDGEQIVEKYADVIEQLLNKMENVEKVATHEAMQNYVEAYLAENPPSGMTDEEREQLQKNTEDISSLSEEMDTKLPIPTGGESGQAIIIDDDGNIGWGNVVRGTGTGRKQLPILHLYGSMEGMSKDTKVKLAYRWIDQDAFADAGHQEAGWVDMKWQGNTSLSKDKKNYNITMYKDPWKQNKDKHKYKEGWGKQSKYTLKANATDLSQCKNIVGARIWSAMTKSRKFYPTGLSDTPNHGAVDGFPCLVYLNNEYLGLYMFNVNKDWMTDIDDTVATNAVIAGWSVTHTEIPDTMTPEVSAGVSALKTYLNDSSNTFEDIDDHMDKESMIDYIIYTWVFAAVDSMSQENFYFMTYDCEKFYMLMYDMDSTLGNNLQGGTDVPYDTPYITADSKGMYNVDDDTRAMLVHFIDVFYADIIERYQYLRQNILSVDYIEAEISDIMDAIGEDAYITDNIKWGFSSGALTSQQKKETLFNWIENRVIYTDSAIKALDGSYVECTGLSLDKTSVTTSSDFVLTATKTPSNATDDIAWLTSNPDVATVTDGTVKCVADGECTITAICGGHRVTCDVVVSGLITWTEAATYKLNSGVITDGNRKLSGKIPVKSGKNYSVKWVSGGNEYWDAAMYKSDGTPIWYFTNLTKSVNPRFNISIPDIYGESDLYIRLACQWNVSNGGDIVIEITETDDVWATALGTFGIEAISTGVVNATALIATSDDSNWWAKNSQTYTMHKVPVIEGQTVTIKNSSNGVIYFYDADGNGISGSRSGTYAINDYSKVAPANSAYCFCMSRVPNSTLDSISVEVA